MGPVAGDSKRAEWLCQAGVRQRDGGIRAETRGQLLGEFPRELGRDGAVGAFSEILKSTLTSLLDAVSQFPRPHPGFLEACANCSWCHLSKA